jgi:hypothetical protein
LNHIATTPQIAAQTTVANLSFDLHFTTASVKRSRSTASSIQSCALAAIIRVGGFGHSIHPRLQAWPVARFSAA